MDHEPLTDGRSRYAQSSSDSMDNFVEIVEHPVTTTATNFISNGLGNQPKRFLRGPISFAPRNLVLNSPLKVRKTRENLRDVPPRSLDEKGHGIQKVDMPHLGVGNFTPRDVWSAPMPKIQSGASGILLAANPNVPANIETTGHGFRDNAFDDQSAPSHLHRSQSLRQRVVTKVRKFSYKTKSVMSLPHSGILSRQTSFENLQSPTSDFEPSLTSTPIKMDGFSFESVTHLSSPPPPPFGPPFVAGNGAFLPDGTMPNGNPTAPRGPVQHSRATLSASMSIRTEVDYTDISSDEAIWASVQIKGDVRHVTARQHQGYPVPSLAVAVIIDTSSFTSKLSLESACEQAVAICRLLRVRGDQIAVYSTTDNATTYQHTNDVRGYIDMNEIYAMDSPNHVVLRRLLETVQAASPETDHGPSLEVNLIRAADALKRLNINRNVDALTAQREIIVIAPMWVSISNEALELEGIRVNLITSGIIPLRVSPRINGWCINTAYQVPEVSHPSQNENGRYTKELAVFIAAARFAIDPGAISNLFVDIIPGPETIVEEVIGPTSFSELLPGQSKSILLKLRVKSVHEIIRNRNTRAHGHNDNIVSLDDAFTDLEAILGELLRELITVAIRYKHSDFPDNTELGVKEKCWIRRTSSPRVERNSNRPALDKQAVQRNLALALASHSKPQKSLRALEVVFDNANFTNTVPYFVEHIREELDFQTNTSIRRNIQRHPLMQLLTPHTPPLSRLRSTLEMNTASTHQRAYAALRAAQAGPSSLSAAHVRPPSHVDAEGLTRRAPLPAAPGRFYAAFRANNNSNEAPASPSPSAVSVQSTDTTGPLRFWRSLRQVSRGRTAAPPSELLGTNPGFGGNTVTDHVTQIRNEAVRNRRSIGTDTLRSMARSFARGGESSRGGSRKASGASSGAAEDGDSNNEDEAEDEDGPSAAST